MCLFYSSTGNPRLSSFQYRTENKYSILWLLDPISKFIRNKNKHKKIRNHLHT